MKAMRSTLAAIMLAGVVWLAAGAAQTRAEDDPVTPPASNGVPRVTFDQFPPDAATFKLYIRNRERRVAIVSRNGVNHFLIERTGKVETLTPDEFARAMIDQQEELNHRPWLMRAFNITSWVGVAWVTLGLLGQAMFTFRMVLQWLASEKQGKSIVPVAFWWGSLIGGVMLLAYFIWRQDIVGIIGQSTGAIIYARNLVLIYRSQPVAVSR